MDNSQFTMANLMQLMESLIKKQNDMFEENMKRLDQLKNPPRKPPMREYYNPNVNRDYDTLYPKFSPPFEHSSFDSFHSSHQDVNFETRGMKQSSSFKIIEENNWYISYCPTHPPNCDLSNDLHLETFLIPSEPNLIPSDQLSVDDDSCLEDLIFKDPLEVNNEIMENLPLDPLDFDLRENLEEHHLDLNDQIIEDEDLQFEDLISNHFLKNNDSIMENFSLELIDLREDFENHYLDLNNSRIKDEDIQLEDLILNHPLEENDSIMTNLSSDDVSDFDLMNNYSILEDVSNLTLELPSFGRELISSSYFVFHATTLQVPHLEPWMIEYEPSSFEPPLEFDSYLFDVADTPPIFFEPVVRQFFRLSGFTLHHQLVSLIGISVVGADFYTYSILWILGIPHVSPTLRFDFPLSLVNTSILLHFPLLFKNTKKIKS